MRPLRRLFAVVACTALSLLSSTVFAAYNIGVGKSDITGPAVEIVMMGYADAAQVTAGLLNRLYARAFIVEDTDTKQRVAIVNCDLLAVFQLIQQEVLKELRAKYGSLYSEQNVALLATHSHSTPGGSSAYMLYDTTIGGFVKENFDQIVVGIMAAFEKAHDSLAPGSVSFNKGQISNASKNRSPLAYLANRASERAQYATDYDVDMRVLQFRSPGGQLRGALAWFPVHPTSLTKENHFISGDNKGYAEFVVEEKYPNAVIGISISNAADVSPNRIDNGNGTFRGEGKTDIESAEIIGGRQASKLLELLKSSAEEIKGSVVGKLAYVDYSNITIEGAVATEENPYAARTCPAVLGQNFAAGTEDGRGMPDATEGDLKPNTYASIGKLLGYPTPDWVQKCHGPNKIAALPVGEMEWVPTILPVQVIKIGQFGLGVTNFEVSTMAGRRLRTALLQALAPAGVKEVEIAAISNAYAQYLTTPEEYEKQHYEGASTLFGHNQLAALRQELLRVAKSVVDPKVPLDVGPTPRQFKQGNLTQVSPNKVSDTAAAGKKIGDLRKDVLPTYKIGDTVVAEFFGANPRNQLNKIVSFCDVEKQNAAGNWSTHLRDAHWDVRYEWYRVGTSESRSLCKWYARKGNPSSVPGLRHYGFVKAPKGVFNPYQGVSSPFAIN